MAGANVSRMTTPSDLKTTEGKRAWTEAIRTLEADGRDPETLVEPLKRYARAADLEAKLREEWIADGSPATTLGGVTGKLIVEHPMIRSIRAASEHSAKLWQELIYPPRRGQVGRPKGSTSAPDRAAPPKLRMFEGGGA